MSEIWIHPDDHMPELRKVERESPAYQLGRCIGMLEHIRSIAEGSYRSDTPEERLALISQHVTDVLEWIEWRKKPHV
jgi:hypothetical protein